MSRPVTAARIAQAYHRMKHPATPKERRCARRTYWRLVAQAQEAKRR